MSMNRSLSIALAATTVAAAGTLAFALPASAHGSGQHHHAAGFHTKASRIMYRRDGGSTTTTQVPTVVVPSKPCNLTATAGNAQVVLTWSAAQARGASITGYSVQISTDSGTTWTTLSDPNLTTTYTATGLSNGTSYLFRVAGEDSAGTGAYAITMASPVAVSVTAPSNATVRTASVDGVPYAFLSWSAPQSPANPVSGYTVEMSTDGGTTWVVAAANISGTAIALPTQSGTSYEVAAESTAGLSDFASFTAPSNNGFGPGHGGGAH